MTGVIDPEKLPPVFPVQTASRVLGIGRNQTYAMIKAGRYPIRVLDHGGRFRCSRYDLLTYLGADGGQAQPASVRPLRPARAAGGAA